MATQEGNPLALVEELRLRANQDEGLKARLLADPHATIESETGIKIPGGWVIAATSLADGTVNVDLANEEIPEEYLELVSGGGHPYGTASTASTDPTDPQDQWLPV